MSEYQYYEFAAIDRPLTRAEMAELAEGYALKATRKAFGLELRRLLVRHATRGALLRRLSEAGLWAG